MQKFPVGLTQKIDSASFAILPLPELDTVKWKVKNITATNLTEEEFKKTEAILNAAIASIGKRSPESDWLLNYRRQYIPYINEKGEKLVWVSCFCGYFDMFKSWKTEIADTDPVLDGGACFIHVTINLTQNSFTNLQTHGLA